MAINIFSGSKPSPSKKTKTVNKRRKSRDTGNQDVRSMVSSNEGTVAVKKKGILGTIGSLAKKAIPLAAKFAPGPIGTAAKIAENFFNDQEWWEEVPGQSVTMNAPLASVPIDDDSYAAGTHYTPGAPTDVPTGVNYTHLPQRALRAVMLEITSHPERYTGTYHNEPLQFFHPNDDMMAQYFMTEIRRVVNAIPLQTAQVYKEVLANNAMAYAVWQQLKAVQYQLKHGQTYLPSFNDAMFPIYMNDNKSWLDATVLRLEEFLHASVRLPHTLCEYLAWRYGRIYKINANAKSALVRYSVYPLNSALINWQRFVNEILSYNTASTARQQAATDIFNAFIDHDLNVVIAEDTQFKYDMKEFALRTNLDCASHATTGSLQPAYFGTKNPIKIDSEMDNPSVFMSSTVSTIAYDGTGATGDLPLFPVEDVWAYVAHDLDLRCILGEVKVSGNYTAGTESFKLRALQVGNYPNQHYQSGNFDRWSLRPFIVGSYQSSGVRAASGAGTYPTWDPDVLMRVFLAKTLEYYNAGFFFLFTSANANTEIEMLQGAQPTNVIAYDVTSLSDDLGVVDDVMIRTEQVYAFANLVSTARKHSMSYKQAEAIVAKETANTIAGMDITAKA